MPRRIESHLLPGPVGKLECLLEEPEDGRPQEAIVVCHPHPQFGGTMHNKVVYRLARGLRNNGAVVLRFNYRGVNLSEGEYDEGRGEVDDAEAALRWLRHRYARVPFSLAGFSFGARIALKVGCATPGTQRVLAVAFPTKYDREYLKNCTVRKEFIHCQNDELSPQSEMEQVYAMLPEPKLICWVPGEDHFFKGALDEFEQIVRSLHM